MIRFVNTRTGRRVPAKSGRDAAAMVKIESDRRSGIEATAWPPDSEQLKKAGAVK